MASFSGELEKRGRFNKAWKRRHFELDMVSAVLSYAKPGKGGGGRKVKGSGRLTGARPGADAPPRVHCIDFDVEGRRSTLRASADTEEERRRWLEAAETVLGSSGGGGGDGGAPPAPAPAPEPASAAAARSASAGVDRARSMQDKAQALLERFGGALAMLEAVLAAGSKLPVFGGACRLLRDCAGVLGSLAEVTQDVLDFGEKLVEAAEHLRSVAQVAARIEGAAAEQLARLLEAVKDLVADGCEALATFGRRGWLKAMIKAACSLGTFGKLAQRLAEKFAQIQTTILTAQISLTLDLKEQQQQQQQQQPPCFVAEAAVARQVEAMLQHLGGSASEAADVEKAAAAVALDEGALQKIQVEAGLGEALFKSEMAALHEELGALAAGQQRLGSQIDVLVDKKKAAETKEQALEQNRIDPADVTRTGKVLGTGAHGIVTVVCYAGGKAALKSLDLSGLTVEQRNKVYVRSSTREFTSAFSFFYCLTRSLPHSLTHSLTHLLTHSLTYSLAHANQRTGVQKKPSFNFSSSSSSFSSSSSSSFSSSSSATCSVILSACACACACA